MRSSHALLAFIAVAFLVLSTGWALAADAKGKPDPFLALQQQIDDLKAQMEMIQSASGPADVYDNNGQHLGILLGPDITKVKIFVPGINWPTTINGRYGYMERPNGENWAFRYTSSDCSGTCYTDMDDPVDTLLEKGTPSHSSFQYFVVRSGRKSITAYSERDFAGGCVVLPTGLVFSGHEVLQVNEVRSHLTYPWLSHLTISLGKWRNPE